MRMSTYRQRSLKRLPMIASVMLLPLLASACFQPSGAALEATQGAPIAFLPSLTPEPVTLEALSVATDVPADLPLELPTEFPTITPSPVVPTDTPSPVPTDTPEPFPTLTFTPSPTIIVEVTAAPPPTETINPFQTIDPTRFMTPMQVAMLPVQQLDPILQTATQLAIQAGMGGGLQQFGATEAPAVLQVDPLLLTATAVIAGATQTVAAPLTQTAQAIFGPSPTPGIVVPTVGIITPPPGMFPTATPSGPIPGVGDCIHEVQPTDRNLFRISLAYGLTVQQIAAASGIVNPSLIYVGQRLVIPGCGTTGFRPPPTSVPTSGGSQFPIDPGTNVCGPVYIVNQGDTLFEISLRCGVPVMTIAQLNGITNINLIFINQELRLQ